MPFQWLTIRIAEEKDRRRREARVQESLPRAFDELYMHLTECVQTYGEAFGPDAVAIRRSDPEIEVIVREERGVQWSDRARVQVRTASDLPGFRVEGGSEPVAIEMGLLAGDKLFYKIGDQYLTMEQITRRILDRAFFPNLGE